MTWAYSPSYGKPLSVPQGVIGLFTRFGMDVVLAHPEGYEVMDDVIEVAKENAAKSGGSFAITNSMDEAKTVAAKALEKCADNNKKDWASLKSSLKSSMGDFMYTKTKRKPMILPIIMEV